jgi:RHS repeat-associated protein
MANRLTSVNGITQLWDNNGNLLGDGTNIYSYDFANRLTSVNGTHSFGYNGLGDRLVQGGVHYTLDLNAGLSQVLKDDTKTYLYGLGRISQYGTAHKYFLGDALGSVRQLTDINGTVSLAKSYDPYGQVTSSNGTASSYYGFAGEYTDATGLMHLRARYYSPAAGRFISRDVWEGSDTSPISYNRWSYANDNPIRYTDPSGHCIFAGIDTAACIIALAVGIPLIAGVAAGAYDYAVTQGGGLNGFNADHRECIDLRQVLQAGINGFLGALTAEGFFIAAIPLGPLYLVRWLTSGQTPVEVNMEIMARLGLDDNYMEAMRNPYFAAGQLGGTAGTAAASLATMLKGLANIINAPWNNVYSPSLQPGGLLGLNWVVSLPGIQVFEGTLLTGAGVAGLTHAASMGKGAGWRGPQNKAQGSKGEADVKKILEERGFDVLGKEVDIEVSTSNGVAVRRVDFLVRDANNKIFAVEVKTGAGKLSARQQSLDPIMSSQGGTIRSHNVPPGLNGMKLDSLETIYITIP